ncbi:hypothetical protein [Sorangium sp. So ce128]|uniref:hypothetical protein n=1 Tax=Sorangium sp. So ce128 TaxID=3133281 RepID=UPI003F632539
MPVRGSAARKVYESDDRTASMKGRRRVSYGSVTMKRKPSTGKNRRERFSTKEKLLAQLLPQCTKEYEKAFGHVWSPDRMARVEALTQRWRVEAEAWRVMYEFRKAAAKALEFFESRGLELRRPDNGLFYAYRLHKLVTQRRRFLESLVNDVREDYERPADRRHWLAWTMNFATPNAFAKLPQDLPYGRKLSNRELAILSILTTDGEEVDFKRDMTVSDAIEQELRRMARAAERAPLRLKKVGSGYASATTSDGDDGAGDVPE